MSIDVYIKDGKGTGNEVTVNKDNSMLVTTTQIPPEKGGGVIRPFRAYLKDVDGSSDMRVNGNSSSVDFFLTAPTDGDRYIDTISIAIADAGSPLNRFGNLTALSTGVTIFYEDSELGNVVIGEGLTSNFEFIRLCGVGSSPVGQGTNAYRANNVIGQSEGYIMSLDFSEVFGIPWGVRLKKNSTLRLVVRINDNVSNVDKFDMIAYGYDRIIK